MKVIKRAIKNVYRFICPDCGSELEADLDEVRSTGNGWGATLEAEFHCPVCDDTVIILRSCMTRYTIYEDKTSEQEEEA